MDKIYVLHEYGAYNHYNGLSALCKQHNIKLVFREFRFLHLIGSGIEHRNLHRVTKQAINFCFLINLLFTSGKTIVLGMHPYDRKLPILLFLLRNHRIFYHSSFTAWNPSDMEKYKRTSVKKINRIRNFIQEKTVHIFAVTDKAKNSICSFSSIKENKISVVYHSYTFPLEPSALPSRNTYIYVGRMDKDKGIEELCEYFSRNLGLKLTLIGDGDDVAYVKQMASINENIHYKGYLGGLSKLAPYYQKSAFFVLNSKRTKEWEELFGQVLIESMSCGCIPVSVSHSGPKEIIIDHVNGFLFSEGHLEKTLDEVSRLSDKEYADMRENSILKGHSFSASIIAKRWEPILNL